jgi:DNA-directed RNA polymerase specialized sigma24 family protein
VSGFYDRRLLDRLASGDEQALAETYDRHAAAVYGTALRITGEADDAASVTETVFVEVWAGAPRYAASTVPLLSLLTALAHHHAHRRTHSRSSLPAAGRGLASSAPVLACVADQERGPWT